MFGSRTRDRRSNACVWLLSAQSISSRDCTVLYRNCAAIIQVVAGSGNSLERKSRIKVQTASWDTVLDTSYPSSLGPHVLQLVVWTKPECLMNSPWSYWPEPVIASAKGIPRCAVPCSCLVLRRGTGDRKLCTVLHRPYLRNYMRNPKASQVGAEDSHPTFRSLSIIQYDARKPALPLSFIFTLSTTMGNNSPPRQRRR